MSRQPSTAKYHWTSKDKAPSISQINLDTIAAAAARRKNGVTKAPPATADNAVRIFVPFTALKKNIRRGGMQ